MIGSLLDGKAMPERAEIFGLSVKDYLALLAADARLSSPGTLWGLGFERLRSWLAAGRPKADRGAAIIIDGDLMSPLDGRSEDPGVEAIGFYIAVREVLAALPEPVAEFVVRTTALVACPHGGGWCGDMIEIPASVTTIVVLSSLRAGTIAHELGHCWQLKHERRPGRRFEIDLDAGALAYAENEVATDNFAAGSPSFDLTARMLLEREFAADCAATDWLGRLHTSVDGGDVAALRREIEFRAKRAGERAERAKERKVG